MSTNIKQLPKQKTLAFKKDVYLLGADENGVKYWLEAPSWECGWYWGFGYIETYTNNDYPSKSKDINSHEHATDFMSKWFTEWNGSKPQLAVMTFTEREGWELSELFKQFYFLKESAEYFKNGKANVSDTVAPRWEKPEFVTEINQILIPAITSRILEILTPPATEKVN